MADRRSTAFVLAGGGAKGAFETGAVRYLVEEAGITPDVITAASAGSILGVVLAQARTPEEFRERVNEATGDLLSMTGAESLFGAQPWLSALDGTPLGTALGRFMTERTRPPVPGESLGWPGPVTRAPRSVGAALASMGMVARSVPSLVRAPRLLRRNAGSVLTLEPLGRALRHGGGGMARVDPALVARPGLQLRLAVTALGAGVLRYVTGDGTIVEADARTPAPGAAAGPTGVIDGVLASCSVPLVFAPQPLADDVYVDGGVLQNIPVAAAARLGARRIYAVLAVPLEPGPDRRDYTRANMVGVFLRSVGDIAFIDRQRADLAHPLPDGTTLTVVDPLVDVVGPFEVEPGLMRISMDYGWCRAADVTAEVDPATRSAAGDATEAVVVGRTRAWHLEERLWSAEPPRSADHRALAECKRTVREAVEAREKLGLPTPLGCPSWWGAYEAHGRPRPAHLAPTPPGVGA